MVALENTDDVRHYGQRDAITAFLIFNRFMVFWLDETPKKIIIILIIRFFVARGCPRCLRIFATLKHPSRNAQRIQITSILSYLISDGRCDSVVFWLSVAIQIYIITLLRLIFRGIRITLLFLNEACFPIRVSHFHNLGEYLYGIIKVHRNIRIVWSHRIYGVTNMRSFDQIVFWISDLEEFRNSVILAKVVFQDRLHVFRPAFPKHLLQLFILEHLIKIAFLTDQRHYFWHLSPRRLLYLMVIRARQTSTLILFQVFGSFLADSVLYDFIF